MDGGRLEDSGAEGVTRHHVITFDKIMATVQTTLSPHNQQPLVSRAYPSREQIDGFIRNASVAQKVWAKVSLSDRIAIGRKFIVGIT